MQILFDHINAYLIAGTILFVLAAFQFRAKETSVNDQVLYTARTQALDLVSLLEDDLLQLPHQLEVDALLFDWPDTTGGNTTEITVYIDQLKEPALIDTVRTAIRYQLVAADTIDSIPLFQLDRSTCEGPPGSACAWQYEDLSASTLRSFSIVPLDSVWTPATNAANTRYFRIDFTLLPFASNPRLALNELTWGTTIRIQP